jgi:hypothetical protein
MFRRTLARVAVPAVVAAVLLMAGPVWAQHRGGGGRGGGDPASAGASSGGSTRSLEIILKASGVPNRNGHLAWPSVFRVLPTDGLVQQVEAELQVAAEQVIAGGANPLLLNDIQLNVEALYQVLRADREYRFSMPLAVYEDAERFLQKLHRAPQVLAGSAPAVPSETSAR